MEKIIASALILATLSSYTMMCAASNFSLYDCWSDDSSDEYHYGSEFRYFDHSSDISEDTDTAQTKSILHNELTFKEFYRRIENAIEHLQQNNENPIDSMIDALQSTASNTSNASTQYATSIEEIKSSFTSYKDAAPDLAKAQKEFFENSQKALEDFQLSLNASHDYVESIRNVVESIDSAYNQCNQIRVVEFEDLIGNNDIVKTSDLYSASKEVANFKNAIESFPFKINDYQELYTELSEKIAAASSSSQNLSNELDAGIKVIDQSSCQITSVTGIENANIANRAATQTLSQFCIDNKEILNSGSQIFENIFPLDLGPASLYPNLQINYDAYNYDAWN